MERRRALVIGWACACGPTAPTLDGDGSADDTGSRGDEASASASAEGAGVESDPTFDPDDGLDDGLDDGDTSGGATELCSRAPSGLVPGSVIWEVARPGLVGSDIVATDYGVAIAASYDTYATIQGFSPPGEDYWSANWEAPDSVGTVARQIVALTGGVVVAALDGVPFAGACDDCRTHWLVAYDDTGDPQWEMQIAGGQWAIAATPSDTIVAVDTLYWQDEGYITTLHEVGADGVVVREVATNVADIGSPTHVVVGATGIVTAIGTRYGGSEGGWLAAWNPDYVWTEMLGGSDSYLGLAPTSNGDVVVPERGLDGSLQLSRRRSGGSIVWDVPLSSEPRDVAVDCNDDIVLAEVAVTRLDPDGTPLWDAAIEGEAIAVAIDPAGDVLTLTQVGDELQIAKLAGM